MIASPPLLADMEKRLTVEHNIIRFLITKVGAMNNRRDDEHDETLITTDNAPSPTLSLIQATSSIDYYVARTLLSFGVLKREDILALPRRRSDSEWNKKRQSLQQEEAADERSGAGGGAVSSEANNSRALTRAFDVAQSFASELSESTNAIVQYHKYRQAYNDAADTAREQFNSEEVRLSGIRVDYLATKWIEEHCRKLVRAEFREYRRIGQKKDAEWSAQRLQQLIDSKRRQLDRLKREKMKGLFDVDAAERAARKQDHFNVQTSIRAKKWTTEQTRLEKKTTDECWRQDGGVGTHSR